MLTSPVKMIISGISIEMIYHGWITGSAWPNDIVRSFGNPDLDWTLVFRSSKIRVTPVDVFYAVFRTLRTSVNKIGELLIIKYGLCYSCS